MAYQKLQPSEAGEIILSNTINVISPSQTPSVGGVNALAVTNQLHDFTVAPVGRTGVITTGTSSQVVDTSANFLSSPAIQVGDTVTTTTGSFAVAYVTAVDSATELTIDTNIVGTTLDNYSIHQGPGFAGMVSIGDLILNVTNNTVTACTAVDQTYLTFASAAFPLKGDVYKAYGNASQLNSNTTAFVVYVAATASTTETLTIKVTTAAGNDITFSHFPTGTFLPVQCLRVWATGTDATATNLIALW